MTDLARMSAEELHAFYDRTFSEWMALAYAMLYAGYGNATHEQVEQMAISGGDPLADRFMSIDAKLRWVKSQCEWRMYRQGSLKPLDNR